jgi:hypothetical protein
MLANVKALHRIRTTHFLDIADNHGSDYRAIQLFEDWFTEQGILNVNSLACGSDRYFTSFNPIENGVIYKFDDGAAEFSTFYFGNPDHALLFKLTFG